MTLSGEGQPRELTPRPEALPRLTPDEALPLAEVCRRLSIGVRTFYTRDAAGYWGRYGLVELPRPAGSTRGAKRRFSAASVDRLIRGGDLTRRLRA